MNLYDPDQIRMRQNWKEDVFLGGRNDLAGYYAAITFIDHEIGRLLSAIQENGQADNTIVLLTSDHGDMLGSQGTFLKRKPWEESILVPGILRYPAAVEAGIELEFPFSHVDMPPTLLGLAGLEVPAFMEGVDVSGRLKSRADSGPPPESVYIMNYTAAEREEFPPWRGVRTARYTYARHRDKPWLLYDNQEDPFQSNNLAGLPERAQLQAQLDGLTMEWFRKTGDDWTERHDMAYA
jgi:arylsulfatase A-like enzyme